jgi:hypothetical protein
MTITSSNTSTNPQRTSGDPEEVSRHRHSSNDRKDLNRLAKSVVDLATGNVSREEPQGPEKNPAAVALGRLGGLKGGAARASKLTPAQRSEIARVAASARWKK